VQSISTTAVVDRSAAGYDQAASEEARTSGTKSAELAQRKEVEELDVLMVGAGFAGPLIAS
jgi:hypothetical protein